MWINKDSYSRLIGIRLCGQMPAPVDSFFRSAWVYSGNNNNNCATNCASNCASNAASAVALRRGLLGVWLLWDKILPTCGTQTCNQMYERLSCQRRDGMTGLGAHTPLRIHCTGAVGGVCPHGKNITA